METAAFYMARTVDRPKRLVSKTAQPLQHAAKKRGSAKPASTPAKSKVRLVRKKSAVTVATAGGRTGCSGLYKEEIRIMKKQLNDMDNRLKTVSRELEVEKQFRKAVEEHLNKAVEDRAKAEERFKKVEELLQRLVNPPPAAAQLTAHQATAAQPTAHQATLAQPPAPHTTASARRQLTFNATPSTLGPRVPAGTPLPDIELRVLSAERDDYLFRQSQQRGQHRPDIYAANVFMALTPFEERWGKMVNWSGSQGKATLPHNLKKKVHQLTTERFPDLSPENWVKIRNRINERLRSPRKVDPEAERIGH
ncbi:uncharacterized protein LOC132890105 [Neoarius graeffei]|uniref:uncharacterized protein LOC132890105 n=1 Tax=Neoarius graeffei TaxID=443677 RepID=UPI00298C9AAD|nr:uncharacterized protein LOC132890105 [Neoarius graeffei]